MLKTNKAREELWKLAENQKISSKTRLDRAVDLKCKGLTDNVRVNDLVNEDGAKGLIVHRVLALHPVFTEASSTASVRLLL